MYNKLKYFYDKANYGEIREKLKLIDWKNELKCANINEQWQCFHKIIMELVNKYVPRKLVTVSNTKRIPLDKTQVSLIKQKHKIWNKYYETKDKTIHKKACQLRNKVKNMMSKARKQFEKDI